MQVVEKEHTHKNREGNPSTVPQQQVPTFVQIPARTHTACSTRYSFFSSSRWTLILLLHVFVQLFQHFLAVAYPTFFIRCKSSHGFDPVHVVDRMYQRQPQDNGLVRFVPRQFQHLGLFQPRLQVRQQHRVTKIIDVRQQRLGMDVAQHRQHSETAGPYHRIH